MSEWIRLGSKSNTLLLLLEVRLSDHRSTLSEGMSTPNCHETDTHYVSGTSTLHSLEQVLLSYSK